MGNTLHSFTPLPSQLQAAIYVAALRLVPFEHLTGPFTEGGHGLGLNSLFCTPRYECVIQHGRSDWCCIGIPCLKDTVRFISSDPHAWLYPLYAKLRRTHTFGWLSPSHQFKELAKAVEREHPAKAATMREWSPAAQIGLLGWRACLSIVTLQQTTRGAPARVHGLSAPASLQDCQGCPR